jgi:hypothetical protein
MMHETELDFINKVKVYLHPTTVRFQTYVVEGYPLSLPCRPNAKEGQ